MSSWVLFNSGGWSRSSRKLKSDIEIRSCGIQLLIMGKNGKYNRLRGKENSPQVYAERSVYPRAKLRVRGN
jgi:hypothetical protein